MSDGPDLQGARAPASPANNILRHRRSNRSELAGGWWMRCIERLKFCGVSVSESVALSFAPGELGDPIGKCRRDGQSRDGQLAAALFCNGRSFHCFRLSEMTFMAVAAAWLTLA
jgi:hypothetical protein